MHGRATKSGARGQFRAEAEGPAGVLLELDAFRGGALYGALDAIDRCVEVPPGYLQGRLFGLTDLFLDALLLDRQAGVAADFPAHGAGELLVVAGVRGEFSRGGRRE